MKKSEYRRRKISRRRRSKRSRRRNNEEEINYCLTVGCARGGGGGLGAGAGVAIFQLKYKTWFGERVLAYTRFNVSVSFGLRH